MFKFKKILVVLFMMVFCHAPFSQGFAGVGGGAGPSDYFCGTRDPIQNPEDKEPKTAPCIYYPRSESAATIVKDALQLLLTGGAQTFGDHGKIETYKTYNIVFYHEDPKKMVEMLNALRLVDHPLPRQASNQITFQIDVYLLNEAFSKNFNLSAQFLSNGIVPSGTPRAQSSQTPNGSPAVNLNIGNLSTQWLNILLGHAKSRAYQLEHHTNIIKFTHNVTDHLQIDMQNIYIGSMDKNPAQWEQVGLQVMGAVSFVEHKSPEEPYLIQLQNFGIDYATRSGQKDSLVTHTARIGQSQAVAFGQPIYLMHKVSQFSSETKGQGLIFYEDGKSNQTAVLLVVATPIEGESRLYGKINGDKNIHNQKALDVDVTQLEPGDKNSLREALNHFQTQIESYPNILGYRLRLVLSEKYLTQSIAEKLVKIDFQEGPRKDQTLYRKMITLVTDGIELTTPVSAEAMEKDPREIHQIRLETQKDSSKDVPQYQAQIQVLHFVNSTHPSAQIQKLKIEELSFSKAWSWEN